MRNVRSKLLVLLQFILCLYSIRPYGHLLPIRAEGGEPTKEKNQKSAEIQENPENQGQKTENEVLQKAILKRRFPRYDDVSIYYHFRFFLLIKPIS